MTDVDELNDGAGTSGSSGVRDAHSEGRSGAEEVVREQLAREAEVPDTPADEVTADVDGRVSEVPADQALDDLDARIPQASATASSAPAPEVTTGPRTATGAPRRSPAVDPVKALMHRHRELCERAVDPLEIAAGLEAHGVTDRTATRFRHRDVFSLAEEMYARVPRDGETSPHLAADGTPRARADWALLALLPGALCAATVAGVQLTQGRPRLIAAMLGVLAVSLAVRAALSRGPLGPSDRVPPTGSAAWTYWLLSYAVLGDGLLREALAGGPDSLPTGAADAPWPMATVPLLALTLSCAPAAWTAHLFTARACRKLTVSRGLEDFAASVRPLLLGTFALYLCALSALLALIGAALDEPVPYAQATALGALLYLARLLTSHGFTHAPTVVLTAAATAEATALAATFGSRFPGCAFLAAPVDALVDLWGPGGIPALSCAVGALALLVHGFRKLTRASAHAPAEAPC